MTTEGRDQLADIPDEVAELIAPHIVQTTDTLDAISVSIARRRDEAKAARTSSGIERIWKDCEEAYVGIDDANRAEFQDAKWSKPMSSDGPVTTDRLPRGMEHKSTAFVRLTARYVDAGAAKLTEILLPADDKAFSFSETPVPELIKAKEDKSQVVHEGMGGVPLTRPAKPEEMAQAAASAAPAGGAQPAQPPSPTGQPNVVPFPTPGTGTPPPVAGAPATPPAPPTVPLTVADLAEEAIEIARKAAKAAEQRIYDWMVECQYTAEMRKVIFDASRIGVGVVKAPFPVASRGIVVKKGKDGGVTVLVEERVKPAAKWIDPWNIYPDQACGENIHNGDFVFERDYLSERQIRDLKNVPGYIAAQIDKVLIEGPDKSRANENESAPDAPNAAQRKGRYEVWYYYGTLKPEEMDCICDAAGMAQANAEASGKPPENVYAIVTLVNDSIIRATINPLDSGSFPYHSVPWQRRAGHWAGIGVGEQIVMPQKMINAATRSMLNNAGKSAGSQIVMDVGAIQPADGNWTVVPDKIWYKTGDSAGQDVRQAFMAIDIPNVTDQLMKIINYALQIAEESTSIPLITQGQSGATTPDTFGAAKLQDNNANQLLRSIGYAFDDYVTEPVVRQFYEWLLLDPDVPDEEKGEFTINAHGSIALVERAIADQTIAQMAQMVVNPIYGFDPKKWAKQYVKAQRLDPQDFQYTPEQQAKLDAAPPTPPPAVQAAQITADTQLKLGVMKQSTDQQSQQSEERIEQAAQTLEGAKVQTSQQKVAAENTVKLHEIAARERLAMLDYANRNQISLTQAKTDLAKATMTLDTQKQLNAADNAVDLHKHHNPGAGADRARKPTNVAQPPGQLPGRAGDGRAFEQGAQE